LQFAIPHWLSFWRNDEPGPAGKKAESAYGRDGAQPAHIRQRQRVETAAEKDNATGNQEISDPIPGAVQRQNEQHNRMQKVIQHRFVPDFEHPVVLQRPFQSMRAKCTETHGEKAKSGGDPE
jgi:hypothetical protein